MQVYFLFEYYSKVDLETSYPLIVGRFRKLPRATGHSTVPLERMNKLEQKKDKLRNQNMLNLTYLRICHKISASVKKIHNSKVQAQCIVRIHLLTICVKKFQMVHNVNDFICSKWFQGKYCHRTFLSHIDHIHLPIFIIEVNTRRTYWLQQHQYALCVHCHY